MIERRRLEKTAAVHAGTVFFPVDNRFVLLKRRGTQVRVRLHAWAAWPALGLAVLLADTPVSIEPRAKRGGDTPAGPEIRVDTNLVQIPVSVMDPSNRPVTGLDKENFKVFENKVQQQVVHLVREDEPLAVGVIFDTSGSMKKKLQKSTKAAAEFFKIANPEDEFFLVEFDDHARLAYPLTSNPQEIQAQLTLAFAHGRTALWDAIYLGIKELRNSSKPRKALLIVSDGGDNCSRYTEMEVRNLVRENDVMIYAMGIFDTSGTRHIFPEEANGPDLLGDIAEQTGGRLFPVENLNDLPDVAAKIGTELRNRYLIEYAPSNLQRDGKYHKVEVKVAAHGSRAMRVAWRPGYYAPHQ
jgi:VWFA-related protein